MEQELRNIAHYAVNAEHKVVDEASILKHKLMQEEQEVEKEMKCPMKKMRNFFSSRTVQIVLLVVLVALVVYFATMRKQEIVSVGGYKNIDIPTFTLPTNLAY